MSVNQLYTGYLDVKVSAKSRRGFTPWKAWHKQWCEIKRLDSIENGAELKLKTSPDGNIINCVTLPRSSTVCRIESRSKQHAFGIFTIGRSQKPLLFLSGGCESDSQKWMGIIRRALSFYIPIDSLSFHVSIIDNAHSRAAGLTGLFGILNASCQDIVISNPTTGESIVKWKWHQFHQFHLQAVSQVEDENVICVFHTSREFVVGPGQLHFFCQEAPGLLELLVTRGKCKSNYLSFAASHRLSQSEGDLSRTVDDISSNPNYCLRNLSNSDDSGVQVYSGECECHMKENPSSIAGLLSKTPGGSEADDDDTEDISFIDDSQECKIPRGESGISLASGVYEEIPEMLPHDDKKTKTKEDVNMYTNGHMAHVYEDPDELSSIISFKCDPPPLPPRIFSNVEKSCDIDDEADISIKPLTKTNRFIRNTHKYRSSTLPSKDLRRLSQTYASDSEYMVMMMPKNNSSSSSTNNKTKTKTPILVPESLYVPMSPIVNNLKTKIESCYMVMSGKKC